MKLRTIADFDYAKPTELLKETESNKSNILGTPLSYTEGTIIVNKQTKARGVIDRAYYYNIDKFFKIGVYDIIVNDNGKEKKDTIDESSLKRLYDVLDGVDDLWSGDELDESVVFNNVNYLSENVDTKGLDDEGFNRLIKIIEEIEETFESDEYTICGTFLEWEGSIVYLISKLNIQNSIKKTLSDKMDDINERISDTMNEAIYLDGYTQFRDSSIIDEEATDENIRNKSINYLIDEFGYNIGNYDGNSHKEMRKLLREMIYYLKNSCGIGVQEEYEWSGDEDEEIVVKKNNNLGDEYGSYLAAYKSLFNLIDNPTVADLWNVAYVAKLYGNDILLEFFKDYLTIYIKEEGVLDVYGQEIDYDATHEYIDNTPVEEVLRDIHEDMTEDSEDIKVCINELRNILTSNNSTDVNNEIAKDNDLWTGEEIDESLNLDRNDYLTENVDTRGLSVESFNDFVRNVEDVEETFESDGYTICGTFFDKADEIVSYIYHMDIQRTYKVSMTDAIDGVIDSIKRYIEDYIFPYHDRYVIYKDSEDVDEEATIRNIKEYSIYDLIDLYGDNIKYYDGNSNIALKRELKEMIDYFQDSFGIENQNKYDWSGDEDEEIVVKKNNNLGNDYELYLEAYKSLFNLMEQPSVADLWSIANVASLYGNDILLEYFKDYLTIYIKEEEVLNVYEQEIDYDASWDNIINNNHYSIEEILRESDNDVNDIANSVKDIIGNIHNELIGNTIKQNDDKHEQNDLWDGEE